MVNTCFSSAGDRLLRFMGDGGIKGYVDRGILTVVGESALVEVFYDSDNETFHIRDKVNRKEPESITILLDEILRGMK